MNDVQRLCCASAAVLLVVGYLTGFLIAGAATGTLSADVESLTGAHLNAVFGTLLLVAVAWTLPHLSFGEVGCRRLAWSFIVPGFANWAVTLAKAFLHVDGLAPTGDIGNDVIAGLLTTLVVLPSLAGSIGWTAGLVRR